MLDATDHTEKLTQVRECLEEWLDFTDGYRELCEKLLDFTDTRRDWEL